MAIKLSTIMYLAVVFLVLLLPSAFAEPDMYYKKGSSIDLKVPCVNDNSACSPSATCNITVNYPNGTSMVSNQAMTYNPSFFNYTIPDSSKLGTYAVTVYCIDGTENGYTSYSYAITENGFFTNDWTFILAIGIVIIIVLLLAMKLSADYFALQMLLLVFAFLFALLIPSYFVISTTKDIFYKLFMGMLSTLVVFVIIYFSYYGLKKLGVVAGVSK